jgi:aerobic carbon-monoxide dehydrogenase medium subunit
MYAFEYHRPTSIRQAASLIGKSEDVKFLAGGHTLLPTMKLRLAAPANLVDLGQIAELRGIERSARSVSIGAMTPHAQVATSADVREAIPALAELAEMIGDPAVRNRGTIGGNIAQADPASDLPTVLVALGAHIEVVGPRGTRTIDAGHFFTGIMTTSLAEDEIVADIVVPAAGSGEASAYAKFSHPASRYAVVGAAALVIVKQGTCSAVSTALGGLLPHARRLPSVEHALKGKPANAAAVAEAASHTLADVGDQANGDLFASAEYRKAVAPVYVKRALLAAIERAA